MSQNPKAKDLLKCIGDKRSEIAAFLAKTRPRNRRLVNVSIVCSALAGAMTAGPALGGKSLTAWLTEVLGLSSPIWQLLCLGATACSVSAAIATNMSKSHDIASKILRAQTCNAKLEGLETLVKIEQIDIAEASSLYTKYLPEVSFI